MKLVDDIDAFIKISTFIGDSKNNEKAYLLRGTFDYNTETIKIVDFINLDEYTEVSSQDRLAINKKFLYASLKSFNKNKWVYILVHTHPFQTKNTLTFSCIDDDFFKSLQNLSNKIGYTFPLVFGIICSESLNLKIYYDNNITTTDNLYTKFDKYNSQEWNIEVLLNDEYSKAAVYHKNTNSIRIINKEDAKKINKLQKQFINNELSTLQEIAFRKFIYSSFKLSCESKISSNKITKNEKTIDNIEFMVQLGCNLKCKYCYANEGTYGFSQNIILDENNAIKILNSLIKKGVNKINRITFFGGEPSMYPKTINAICKQCKILNINGSLKSIPQFYMITNGTILDELLIKTIKEYGIKVTISLDGPSYINDQLRVNKDNRGTYNIVHNNLIKMRNNGIEPAMVESTYTNVHEISKVSRNELKNFMKKDLGIRATYLADCESKKFMPKTIRNDKDNIINCINDATSTNCATNLDIETLNIIYKIVHCLNNKTLKNNFHCGSGYNMISILGNGDYYPCHRFVENKAYKIGNILDDETDLKLEYIVKKDEIKFCKNCWVSQFCNKCNWNLVNEKDKWDRFNEINSCYKTKDTIKYIILKFINLDAEHRKILLNNINSVKINSCNINA